MLLICDYLLVYFVFCDTELNIFGLWTWSVMVRTKRYLRTSLWVLGKSDGKFYRANDLLISLENNRQINR